MGLSGATDLPNPVESAALARPTHPALVSSCGVLTWRGLASRVRGVAGSFEAQGLVAGQRVGLIGPASEDFVVALHALGWMGAAVAPVSSKAPAVEVEAALGRAGVGAVVVLEGVDALRREAAARAAVLIEAGVGEPSSERFWPLEEVRLVVTTSGTAGVPRPVSLTTHQLMTSAFGSAVRLGHLPTDRWLACLPLNHIGGLSVLLRCAWCATTAVLHEGFEAEAVAEEIDSGRVSLVSLVPRMLEAVLDAREERPFPASLRCILLGGAAASEGLRARCGQLGAPVSLTWGMTETASQVCTRAPGDLSQASGVGAPLSFSRVQVRGERLEVTGPVAVGGRVLTADAGEVDEAGQVQIRGRADEVIVSGGENISPCEVEQVLAAHPAVEDAAVVGVADGIWGQRPVALLVLATGSPRPDLEALRAWCKERLEPFKAPARVVWCERLPRGGLGKLSRGVVREIVMDQGHRESEGMTPSKEDMG